MARAAFEVRTQHVACPMCALDRPQRYRERMYRIAETRFDLVRCPCGFVYVDPRPDGPTLEKMYDDPGYYTDGYNLGVETENYFTRKDELVRKYDREVAALERELGISRGDLLELGSAGGFFLEAARRRGWRVKGIEISRPAVEYSRREMKLDIHAGDLFEAPFADGSFDLVVADNVLEHTLEPDRVLAKLRALLRPGGWLYVIVPSYVNSPFFRAILSLQRVVPRRLLGPQLVKILKLDPDADPQGGGYPYHILEFDRRTLVDLVRRAGFTVERVRGSVPLPADVFKAKRTTPRVLVLRAIFRTLDFGMRIGALPSARLSLVARA